MTSLAKTCNVPVTSCYICISEETHTEIKVVHAVRHQHVVQQSQSWVVVPGEERVVSVRPADVSLCRTKDSSNNGPIASTRLLFSRRTAGPTYQASVSSEEGVPHLLLFTNRLPLHLHSEVLVPADREKAS